MGKLTWHAVQEAAFLMEFTISETISLVSSSRSTSSAPVYWAPGSWAATAVRPAARMAAGTSRNSRMVSDRTYGKFGGIKIDSDNHDDDNNDSKSYETAQNRTGAAMLFYN